MATNEENATNPVADALLRKLMEAGAQVVVMDRDDPDGSVRRVHDTLKDALGE